MVTLVNRAKMSTSTTGTGTITLGSAETGYQTFADAGVANGDVVRYVIEDGNDWEIGSGTYTATGTTLSRTVSESSNADAALNLSGSAVVFITAAAGDVFQGELFAENPSSPTAPSSTGTNAVAIGSESVSAGLRSVSLGDSYASGTDSFAAAIGNNTSSYGATGAGSIAMGDIAKATAADGIGIGYNTLATATRSAAFGSQAYALATRSVSLGQSRASGADSFAAGIGTNNASYGSQHAYSVALGYQAVTSADYQIALGSSTAQVKVSGAYTLPTADGTNGQVLTTDGAGAVTFATPSGGGSALELYAENPSSPTAPSATGTNAVAIGNNARATNINTIALGTANATLQRAFAVNTGSNSTYGAKHNDTVSLGEFSQATSSMAVAIGRSASATGLESLAFGKVAQATASSAIALGQRTLASANYAVALGFYSASSIKGKYAYAGERFAATGDGQTGTYVLLSDTTDATAEALTTSKSAASTDNQVILPNNSAYAFHGTIVARQQASGGTASAAWKIEGLIRREGTAATTTLVNSATTVLDNTPSWGMALSADTTNGGLKIEVTGAAATNIRWVATIHTSEVTYA